MQVAVPSREQVEEYQRLRDEIDRLVGRINGDLGRIGRPAISYLHSSYPREEMAALYRAADIMVVTPYRDGMNLVAKEYVASQYDDAGALVLSEFAGAADELRQAWLVNPYDINGMKSALLEAYRADEKELTKRMRAMRKTVQQQRRRGLGRQLHDRAGRRPRAHGSGSATAEEVVTSRPARRGAITAVRDVRARGQREHCERSLRHSVTSAATTASSRLRWAGRQRQSGGRLAVSGRFAGHDRRRSPRAAPGRARPSPARSRRPRAAASVLRSAVDDVDVVGADQAGVADAHRLGDLRAGRGAARPRSCAPAPTSSPGRGRAPAAASGSRRRSGSGRCGTAGPGCSRARTSPRGPR